MNMFDSQLRRAVLRLLFGALDGRMMAEIRRLRSEGREREARSLTKWLNGRARG